MEKRDEKVIVTTVDETEKTTKSEAPKQEAATEEKKVGFMTKAKNKLSDWWNKPSAPPKEKFKKAAKVGAVIGLGVAAYAVGKKAQETKEFAVLEEGSTETLAALPGDTEVVEEVVDYDEPYVEEEYAE